MDAVLRQPKRAALLAYLAVARPGGFERRDRLLALFWPELDDARARDALAAATRFLRRSLGNDAIVARGVAEIGVAPAVVVTDAVRFREAAKLGRLAEALELYRGPLLDGFHCDASPEFTDWVHGEASELSRLAADVARRHAELLEEEEMITLAIKRARQALEISTNDERMLRRLLDLLHRAGDRVGAIDAYQRFAVRLRREFDAEPSAESRSLLDRIRNDP